MTSRNLKFEWIKKYDRVTYLLLHGLRASIELLCPSTNSNFVAIRNRKYEVGRSMSATSSYVCTRTRRERTSSPHHGTAKVDAQAKHSTYRRKVIHHRQSSLQRRLSDTRSEDPTSGAKPLERHSAKSWYVSNVSIYFYCFILLYYQACMLYMTFYIILETNLLTQCLVPVSVFCRFVCFAEKPYQTKSKHDETLRWFFLDQERP